MIVFDIETGPLPADQLTALIPPFDPDEVKAGNRGPEKAAAYVEECRAAHEQSCIDKAALSPITGRVVCVGYHDGQTPYIDDAGNDRPEEEILAYFWDAFKFALKNKQRLVGFNSAAFDLPFLTRRSWIHGVPVPEGLIERHRYWSPTFVDLLEVWRLGTRDTTGGLDRLCQVLGLPGKLDISEDGGAANFAGIWQADRAKAVEYVTGDLVATAALAERLGVV